MAELDYRYFERLLYKERESVLELISHEEAESHTSLKDSVQELSLIDNHPADTGSEEYERSKDLSLRRRSVYKLDAIDEALQRIAGGTYGTCLKCGNDIGRERLEAVPYTPFCIACKAAQEGETKKLDGEYRPAEVNNHRPGRMDSWEEVARYGTASSPQDASAGVDRSEKGGRLSESRDDEE